MLTDKQIVLVTTPKHTHKFYWIKCLNTPVKGTFKPPKIVGLVVSRWTAHTGRLGFRVSLIFPPPGHTFQWWEAEGAIKFQFYWSATSSPSQKRTVSGTVKHRCLCLGPGLAKNAFRDENRIYEHRKFLLLSIIWKANVL